MGRLPVPWLGHASVTRKKQWEQATDQSVTRVGLAYLFAHPRLRARGNFLFLPRAHTTSVALG